MRPRPAGGHADRHQQDPSGRLWLRVWSNSGLLTWARIGFRRRTKRFLKWAGAGFAGTSWDTFRQTRRVARVNLFDVIHSLDSIDLARRLDRLCAEEGRQSLPLLIQVDLGHEETKSGIDEHELPQLAESLRGLERLQLIGLMTLPPFFDDPEQARPYFRRLRELRDELARAGLFGERSGELSMGMTNDFAVAIEEGATMVRVGTAIFGERHAGN